MTTWGSFATHIVCQRRANGHPTRRKMSSGDLRILLDDVPDTFEIVLRRAPDWSPVLGTWRDAAEDAAAALARWRAAPGELAYAAYRAAQDREDAAQDALVHTQTSRISVS
jgi:hypothetical protein